MRRYPDKYLFIEPGLFLVLALSVWIIPIKWLFAWVLAAIFHELCHIIALIICKVDIISISFGMNGAKIITEPMTTASEIFLALAGPIGGLMLLFFANIFPRISLCALVQSAYNLLPIFPLDGGRALLAALSLIFSGKVAGKAVVYIQRIFAGVLAIFCIYLSIIWRLGILPICICAICMFRLYKANTSCKETNLIVQ